jgi:YfiH family protein
MIKFFENIPEIVAVMSERSDGSMKLSGENDPTLENRKRFFDKIKIGGQKVLAARMTHGSKVEIVDGKSAEMIPEADGLATMDRNVFLSVTVADCVPVYFYEPDRKIIALAHCGWRGIVSGIIKNSVEKISELGGKAENYKVALGPGINQCHFEIRDDILGQFNGYPEFVIRRGGKIFVDLKGIIKRQLDIAGIDLKNLEDHTECTFENDRYYSYRRNKPKVVESMVALIGMI